MNFPINDSYNPENKIFKTSFGVEIQDCQELIFWTRIKCKLFDSGTFLAVTTSEGTEKKLYIRNTIAKALIEDLHQKSKLANTHAQAVEKIGKTVARALPLEFILFTERRTHLLKHYQNIIKKPHSSGEVSDIPEKFKDPKIQQAHEKVVAAKFRYKAFNTFTIALFQNANAQTPPDYKEDSAFKSVIEEMQTFKAALQTNSQIRIPLGFEVYYGFKAAKAEAL